jgi:hypothetical protein
MEPKDLRLGRWIYERKSDSPPQELIQKRLLVRPSESPEVTKSCAPFIAAFSR